MGFGNASGKHVSGSAREVFLKALSSGVSESAAATAAGISHSVGHRWARAAGFAAQSRHSGVVYSAQQREVFWAAMQLGASTAEASRTAGVSEQAGSYWVKQAGFVRRTAAPADTVTPPTARPRAPLTFTERWRLEQLLEQGCSCAEAAAALDRHRDTITREVDRGQTGGVYRAWAGQDVADHRRRRPKTAKLEANPRLRAQVVRRLKQRHSPEQIAGRLREDFPDDPEMWVSAETIYQAIYVQPRGELAKEVKTALRTGRTKRKPQGRNSTDGRGKLKNMINISERPAEAEDRAIPGHWEGDLIIGAGQQSAIGTLVERTTGFVILLHLPGDRTAATLADAMSVKVPEIPEILRRSLTWDQGSEMALHTKITEATGLPIYFCDPHSPWQRGTNENTNGLLRQYFPKGTDLSFYGPGWLDQVAAELNARPRKRLNWRTPAEELDRLLSDPSTFVAATA